MTLLTIDVTRYVELLDLANSLREKKLSLSKDDEKELSKYMIILQNNIFFNERERFLDLITNYFDGKLESYHFVYVFNAIYTILGRSLGKVEEDFRQKSVSTILVDSRSKEFSKIIHSLDGLCVFIMEEDEDFCNFFSEDKFRKEVKEDFIKIQNLLQEE